MKPLNPSSPNDSPPDLSILAKSDRDFEVVIDDWSESGADRVLMDPPWKHVTQALRDLDGRRHTLIIIDDKLRHRRLMIGGASPDSLIVTLSLRTDELDAKSPNDELRARTSDRTGAREIRIGGQEGDCQVANICGIELARVTARQFYDYGPIGREVRCKNRQGQIVDIP